MSPDAGTAPRYAGAMTVLARFLWLLLVVALGLGMPGTAMAFAMAPAIGGHAAHMTTHAATPPAQPGEPCRIHCAGVPLTPDPAALAAPVIGRVTRLHTDAGKVDAPSLWPLPLGHPPRS